MINSKALPSDQCYLEYPGGLIEHVTLSCKDSDFKIISRFSVEKSDEMRKQFNLV